MLKRPKDRVRINLEQLSIIPPVKVNEEDEEEDEGDQTDQSVKNAAIFERDFMHFNAKRRLRQSMKEV